jgi:archaeal cell division control protein 6
LESDDEDLFGRNIPVILKNSDALFPDYIPERIVGRQKAKRQVATLFRPLLRAGSPNNGLIYGPSGSGKTVVTKYVLRLLDKSLAEAPRNNNVQWVYITCKQINAESDILYTLIRELDPSTGISQRGHSMGYYYSSLWKIMIEQGTSMIVVLDEIDFLKSDNLLYNFSRAVSNGDLPQGQFIRIVGLSNTLKFENKLDSRVRSSAAFRKIVFDPYNDDQLFDILMDRVNIAFEPGTISQETIKLCAEYSCKTTGDARRAIELLFIAAEIAEIEIASAVTEEHVNRATLVVNQNLLVSTTTNLPLHHKLTLLSILRIMEFVDEATSGQIYKLYVKMCRYINEPELGRTSVSGIISILETAGLVSTRKANAGSRGGRTRKTTVPEAKDVIKYELYQDDLVSKLAQFKTSTFAALE